MAGVAGPSRPRPSGTRVNTWNMEAETELYNAIAQMNLQDADEIFVRNRYRNVRVTDTQMALRLARQEAAALERFNSDRALALSLQGRGGNSSDEEEPPANARRQTSNTQPGTHDATAVPAGATGQHTAETSGSWIIDAAVSAISTWWWGPGGQTQPIDDRPKTVPLLSLTGHDCVICQDPIRGVEIRAPCGDYYDKSCILDLFRSSTRDESLYPPRCCRQKIPLNSVQAHMSSDLRQLFDDKGKEFGTIRRVYCANPRCSRFLCAQSDSTSWFSSLTVTCPASGCNTHTCSRCRARVDSNSSHTCRTDHREQSVRDVGVRSHWRQCPGCDQLIELNIGCYHMTCLCKTEFCYLCGVKWKGCTCPQWDERRLFAAAEARVDAQNPVPVPVVEPPPPPRPLHEQAPVREILPLNIRRPPVPVVEVAAPPARNDPPAATPRNGVTLLRRIARATTGSSSNSGNNRLSTVSTETTATTASASSSRNKLKSNRRATSATTTEEVQIPQRRPTRLSRPSDSANVSNPEHRQSLSSKVRASWQTLVSNPPDNFHQANAGSPSTSGHPRTLHKSPQQLERERRIRETMAFLREHHDCRHQKWKLRWGHGTCESCQTNLPIFLLRCSSCNMLACRRCRHNRL